MNDAVVVGGGISGLVAACVLAEQGRQVTVIEAEKQLGGLLRKLDYGPHGAFDCGMHNMYETGVHDLDDRELEVISSKYGLQPEGSVSFRELGRRFGLSHEWVRRMSELALVKVRRSFEKAAKIPSQEHEKRRSRVMERISRLGQKAIARCHLVRA